MAPSNPRANRKQFLSKNKSVRIFKERRKKRDEYCLRRQQLLAQYSQINIANIQRFDQFPLTTETKKGLRKHNYVTPTEIQRETIGLTLQSHDILGAAKTGSGKTLAFVVPILERLFVEGWCKTDGLGILVITPTRELALQIYEVCKNVGCYHDFTIGLVIGGKNIREERKILDLYNIVICTPGRMLQHMEQNPLFESMNLQMLVLDEADRILDLGFQKEMNAILEYLPTERQTLLFSATQTKSVKDLARLSLRNPMYVSVHEHAKHATPDGLEQNYFVCELHKKLDFLWSFIKNHLQQKILVFMASCKQVKYVFEAFCHMKPGVTLTALYGGLHQLRRIERYQEFCRKHHVVMFATDLAARGLDFPNVNWVVQLDCPEDVNTYIHRAGRTARYEKGGQSLLVLLPSEKESMVKQLQDRKIPINEIKVHPKKLMPTYAKLQVHCTRDINLKESAQRAFKSYYKSVFLMKDKTVFDITKLDTDAVRETFARSLGLLLAPRIRFIEKRLKNQENATKQKNQVIKSEDNDSRDSMNCKNMFNEDDSDDDDFLIPKDMQVLDSATVIQDDEKKEDRSHSKSIKPLTKTAVAKKILKKKIKPNKKIIFDDEGEVIEDIPKKPKAEISNQLIKEMAEEGFSLEKAKLLLDQEDEIDKALHRVRVKRKHKDEREKLKEQRKEHKPESVAQLPDNQNETDNESSDNDSNHLTVSENEDEERRESNSSEEDSSNEEEEEQNTQKRKHMEGHLTSNTSTRTRKRKYSDENVNELFNTGSLEEDESLALYFLTNS